MTARIDVHIELASDAGGATFHPAVTEIATAARDIFGSNLRLSFVTGSHARGAAKADSDVDILVLIDRPDLDAERAFAQAFRRSHIRHGLKLEHYGEIFDVITAMRLIAYTTTVLSVTNQIQATACYHGDCILSVFRKGDVLNKFFFDEKIAVQGDLALLGSMESDARTYFTRFSMPRIQFEKNNILVPEGVVAYSAFRHLSNLIAETDRINSPVGVGLERWFAPNVIGLDRAVTASSEPTATGPRNLCPLAWTAEDARLGMVVRHQCLGVVKTSIDAVD